MPVRPRAVQIRVRVDVRDPLRVRSARLERRRLVAVHHRDHEVIPLHRAGHDAAATRAVLVEAWVFVRVQITPPQVVPARLVRVAQACVVAERQAVVELHRYVGGVHAIINCREEKLPVPRQLDFQTGRSEHEHRRAGFAVLGAQTDTAEYVHVLAVEVERRAGGFGDVAAGADGE